MKRMEGFTYPDVQKLVASANGDRALYIRCKFQRLVLWIRTRLPNADPSLRHAQCCTPA